MLYYFKKSKNITGMQKEIRAVMQIPVPGICAWWLQWTNSHGLLSPMEEKDGTATVSRGERTGPCLDRL